VDRYENLAQAIHSISCTIEAFRHAGVLTREEYDVIHCAIWNVVIEAKKKKYETLQKLEGAGIL
jgi:hypothetical protein